MRRRRSAAVLGHGDVRRGERGGMDQNLTARHPAAPGDGRTPVGFCGLRPPGPEQEPNPPTTSGCTADQNPSASAIVNPRRTELSGGQHSTGNHYGQRQPQSEKRNSETQEGEAQGRARDVAQDGVTPTDLGRSGLHRRSVWLAERTRGSWGRPARAVPASRPLPLSARRIERGRHALARTVNP